MAKNIKEAQTNIKFKSNIETEGISNKIGCNLKKVLGDYISLRCVKQRKVIPVAETLPAK